MQDCLAVFKQSLTCLRYDVCTQLHFENPYKGSASRTVSTIWLQCVGHDTSKRVKLQQYPAIVTMLESMKRCLII